MSFKNNMIGSAWKSRGSEVRCQDKIHPLVINCSNSTQDKIHPFETIYTPKVKIHPIQKEHILQMKCFLCFMKIYVSNRSVIGNVMSK